MAGQSRPKTTPMNTPYATPSMKSVNTKRAGLLKKMALGTFQIEQDVKVLTWPGQFFPSIGYGLVALFMVAQFIGYLAGRAQMDEPIQTLDDDHAEDFGDGA